MIASRLKNSSYVVAIGLVVALFSSCVGNETYYRSENVKNGFWYNTDTLTFVIDTTKFVVGSTYEIRIETANTAHYPYQNLWLFIQNDLQAKSNFRQDTVQVKLADEFGKWYGSGFSAFYQLSSVYKQNVVFSQKRNYTFRIVQGMRDEPLEGLERVGLKMTKTH